MGNLNALKFGQYLMRMPEEYGNDTILKILDEGVSKLNVELLKAAEANMGWSLAIKDEYSVEPMFGANTNSVRSVLTSNLLYATFTPIGVNNDIFVRAGNDKNLDAYIFNPDDTSTKDKFIKYCEDKINKEIKKDKSLITDEDKLNYKKERMKTLEEEERIRYKLLIKKNVNGVVLNAFIPRVAQLDTLKKYDDVLHPLGVNVPVAFTTDARAFEDTLLIDVLVNGGVCSSKREAREFINNGSISVNGEKVTDLEMMITKSSCLFNKYVIIRRGKKKYHIGIYE